MQPKITAGALNQFVNWFRQASPYIHAHRGRTFVICFSGEAMDNPSFSHLIHDIALLNSLGVRVVLAPGTRSQINKCLQQRGRSAHYAGNIRVTDATALECVKSACGRNVTEIQALFSMGLSNSPSANTTTRTASGNFITARPLGVRGGVDFLYSGEVRRVDTHAISRHLDAGEIVLIPPIGYSPTGEVFNLAVEDVAVSVATALHAAKWICLSEAFGPRNENGEPIRQMTLQETQQYVKKLDDMDLSRQLTYAMRACQQGVERVHLLERRVEGALLLELFSREGIGVLISRDPFENMRFACIEDVGGILELIHPLEELGVLVRRSREKLEMEISNIVVQERDGMIVGCAAIHPFPVEEMAELACLAVHKNYQRGRRGDALLAFIEREAKQQGMKKLFVLTTQTAHWFQERGFAADNLASLPMAKRALYNYQRQSKVFMKTL